MQFLAAARGLMERFSARIATSRRRSEFNCGDCDRWERCGLSPTDVCVIRAAQLVRYDRRLPRRYVTHRMYR